MEGQTVVEKWVSVLKGAGLAAGGVFLAAVYQAVKGGAFGPDTMVIVGVFSVGLNIARKFLPDWVDAILPKDE